MPGIKTLLGLLAAGSVMIDNPLPKHLISKVICVVATVVISAVMVGALLLAGMIYGHQIMVMQYGFTPLEASLCILGVMTCLTILAIIFAVISVRALVGIIPKSIKKNVSITSHLGNEVTQVVQAFFNGLTGKRDS